MFQFKIDQNSLERITRSYKASITEHIDDSLNGIWRDWQISLVNQSKTQGNGEWPSLNPNYRRWKQKNYPNRQMLDLTGDMLIAYMNAVRVDVTNKSVVIPYPRGTDRRGKDLFVKARAHQGVTGRPPGMPARPFSIEDLTDIAVSHFKVAIEKSLKGFK